MSKPVQYKEHEKSSCIFKVPNIPNITKLKMWKKTLLFFIKSETVCDKDDNVCIKSKKLYGRVYVLDSWVENKTFNCRCVGLKLI